MMMLKKFIFGLLVCNGLYWNAVASPLHIMSTDDLLSLTEKNSQSITQARLDELVAQRQIDIARAPYFPILNAEVIDSVGFPGSSGWIGEEGLVGSPFRSGIAGGLVAQQLILDFGRTAADIRASQSQVEVSRQTTRVTTYEAKVFALQAFYQCAKFKKQRDSWAYLAKESGIINKEAKRFVETGQRSIVDNYLSESQTQEALTAHAYLEKRVEGSIKELVIITGIKIPFDCPSLSDKLIDSLNSASRVEISPYVMRAMAGVQVAQEKLKREQADLMPKIIAVASAGGMAKTHLVKKENYSVGLGFIMPIFDFNISSRVHRARAEVIAKQQDISTQKQFINETNAKLDQVIIASAAKIQHLNTELKIAREGFKVAKRRYFQLEGDLVDLREAWRNLARTETTIEDARSDWLQASGVKALLNGGA